ncbi:transcriptional regulator GcvA [Azospirillum doebereinerae]
MARPIPPLNPLHVFECAARHGSFTKAAEELSVTQPAVSRQVALLEDYLGVRLFHRETRGLTLTAEGKRYAGEIGPAFRTIAESTGRLVSARAAEPLKLQVYATFMAKWLMRRMPQLQTQHPALRLRTRTAVAPVDFARDNVDAAIQFGNGDWAGLESVFLFADEIQPVCSPALLAGGPAVERPEDLLRHPLLHSHYRRRDWPDWLASVGLDTVEEREPLVFPSSLLTYQAAVDGLGVAMGQPRLLQSELQSGALVCPLRQSLHRDLGYYFVVPPNHQDRARIALIRNWLLEQVALD